MSLATDKQLAEQLLGAAVDVVEQQRKIINDLRAVLRAVYDETREGVRPYSTDSYLPPHILAQVAAAIDKATPAAKRESA
jgi:hypothetical protein